MYVTAAQVTHSCCINDLIADILYCVSMHVYKMRSVLMEGRELSREFVPTFVTFFFFFFFFFFTI